MHTTVRSKIEQIQLVIFYITFGTVDSPNARDALTTMIEGAEAQAGDDG
jgi:hypothetical protein